MGIKYSSGPYSPDRFKNLDYSKASPDRRYIKILKWYYENGENDKTSAVTAVFKDRPIVAKAWASDTPREILRGYATTFFGQLVNDDLLYAHKDGKKTLFSITEKGEELLKKCGAI